MPPAQPPREPRRESAEDDLRRKAESPEPGLAAEFLQFLGREKKWWLLPIVVAMLVLGALVILGGSPLGPMIYPLF